MNEIKEIEYKLGVVCVYDLLKLDSDSCLNMYKKITCFSPDFLSDLIMATVATLYNDKLLSKNAVENINLLYNEIYKDYIDKKHPEKETYINKGYYKVQEYLKKVKMDNHDKLLFDDIKKRYFGIDNCISDIFKRQSAENYYIQHYSKIMEDIVYDAYVFAYLLGYTVDEEILINKCFANSIRYLYLCHLGLFENKNIQTRTKKILLKLDENTDDKKLKKLIKSLDI